MDVSTPPASLPPPFPAPRSPPISTYYGRPALKPSLYGWIVACYIFIGGLAGAAQIIATAADLLGMHGDAVILAGRVIALAGMVLGGILLIADLHTWRRFYNMLRIFRPTSSMSIGTYVFMTFGFWSLVALCGQIGGWRWLALLGGVIASIAGWGMMSYTAALLAATSTPLWAAAPRLLAVRFASSAMATGAAALVIAAVWSADSVWLARPLRNIIVLALIVEFCTGVASQRVYQNRDVGHPLRASPWGPIHRVGVQLAGTLLPIALYILADVIPTSALALTVAASLCALAGGLLMRGSIVHAGNLSASRPEDYFRFANAVHEHMGG
jgi:MFS family permease